MHITALCPYCRSAYQVQQTLRGQMVRCPNASCRRIFSVPPEEPGPESPPASVTPRPGPGPQSGGSQRSGSVGDIVPILPTEPAAPAQDPSAAAIHAAEVYPLAPEGPRPAEADWWQAAPPVRSKAGHSGEKKAPESRQPTAPPSETPPDAAWWNDATDVRTPNKPTGPAPAPVPSPSSGQPTKRVRRPEQPPAETQQMPVLAPTQQMPAFKPTQEMPALAPEQTNQPRKLPPGVWEPPPVRRGLERQGAATDVLEEIPEDETPTPPVSKRRALLAIVVICFLGFSVLGIAGGLALRVFHKSEAALSKDAYELYGASSFVPAGGKFNDLKDKFPKSDHATEYKFMFEWCDVCDAVSKSDDDLAGAADRLDQFIRNHKKDSLMVREGHVAGLHVVHLAKSLAERSANPADDSPAVVADHIEQVRRTVTGLDSKALTLNESAQIDTDLGNVRNAVERARKRRYVAAELQPRDKELPMDTIKRARAMLARMERELPGITQESKEALAQLEEAHLASVVYHPAKDAPAPPAPPSVDDADVLLFAPLLHSFAPNRAPPNDPIVLALVRGVLYALKQTNGELKWATHVGIDTTVLPQRVPATAFSPELILVLSAETKTLSALDVEGNALWEYHVREPVLGRPIIIDQRAYLADYSGWVHEIELSRGQLLGRWFLGQPLTCGGAREEGTSRIYFPADDSCIYVLDVNPKARRCVSILYDGHPSGSLRSEPVIIPPEGDAAPGYLILNQASGLDAMRLRVFELPLQDRRALPLDLKPQARFDGWTWFEPKQDGEKLAVLSDAGRLGLFGIKQLGNNDPPLFPLLRSGELDLSPFLHLPASAKGREVARERGRSLVIHMRSDDLWVLANGRCQQLHLGLYPTSGPQARPGWKTPLALGSPLHEPQRFEDRNGHSTFYLVTQAQDQQTSLATAVDEDGKIVWQRQLGLVCQGEPLVLKPPGGGPPLLVALDQGGCLFALDPQQTPQKLQSGGKVLKPALGENPLVPPRLLLAADGRSAYEIAVPGDGQELIVRHIKWSDNGRELDVSFESKVSLLAPSGNGVMTPFGIPAVTKSQLLIPMADGTVRGLSLTDEQAKLETGPEWRQQAHPSVIAPSILALGRDRFLTTNGNRGLSVIEWPPDKNKDWQRLPVGGDPHKQLEFLVAAPPVLLPEGANQPARIAVADSAGFLRLFTVAEDGLLQPGPFWELKGHLTAGPFVQAAPEGGYRIGCILDRRHLHWIDPAKEGPLWTYSTDGPTIIGQPQRIEDMLVIALQSGRYVGIDPSTGRPKGRGYTLRTSAAPAATPMPFGPGRMFTPLSDGTALLLSVEQVRQKKQ